MRKIIIHCLSYVGLLLDPSHFILPHAFQDIKSQLLKQSLNACLVTVICPLIYLFHRNVRQIITVGQAEIRFDELGSINPPTLSQSFSEIYKLPSS